MELELEPLNFPSNTQERPLRHCRPLLGRDRRAGYDYR